MTATDDLELRAEILRTLGAGVDVVTELLAYTASGFDERAFAATCSYPLPDEPFVGVWQRVEHEAANIGTVPALRQMLVQLRFAIEEGMSARPEYQAATRRGVLPADAAAGAQFTNPDGVSLLLHPTAAGRLPVIVADSRADFELLVRALTARNEPRSLPASMGACIVGGYNNWRRVTEMRSAWSLREPTLASSEAAWTAEFARLVPQKTLYQDRFIVLSTGPYSDTPAHDVRLSADEWRRLSLTIRLEHECAHYFTRRVFGSMRNSLLDELIADYTGIVAARGRFEPEWLMRFMGVEERCFRPGGRLGNYRGTPALSDTAFGVLQEMVRRAASTLATFDNMVQRTSSAPYPPRTLAEVAAAITAIARLGLERLTERDAAGELHAEFVSITTDEPVCVLTS